MTKVANFSNRGTPLKQLLASDYLRYVFCLAVDFRCNCLRLFTCINGIVLLKQFITIVRFLFICKYTVPTVLEVAVN